MNKLRKRKKRLAEKFYWFQKTEQQKETIRSRWALESAARSAILSVGKK